jgi:antitoxin HicB
MNSPLRYSMRIQWSEEDAPFLVTLPEWEGKGFNPVTHGDTYEAAVSNGHMALEDLVTGAQERVQPLPEPRFFGVAARLAAGHDQSVDGDTVVLFGSDDDDAKPYQGRNARRAVMHADSPRGAR